MTPHNPDSALYENDRFCLMCVYRPDRALCHPDRTRSPNGNSSPDLTNVACIDWDIADMEKTARQLRAVAASPDTPLLLAVRAKQCAERMEEIIAKHRERRIVNPGDAL